jgi:hypothetical protein
MKFLDVEIKYGIPHLQSKKQHSFEEGVRRTREGNPYQKEWPKKK